MYDFHTHTIFSDGELIPAELIRRAKVHGYRALAITDHVDQTNMEHIINSMGHVKKFENELGMRIIIGVELTHIPPVHIEELAKEARDLGVELVLVHGETIVEPVAKGTNKAAVACEYVDVLAHPGLVSLEDAATAADNGVMLEISARSGHCLTNGHVARVSQYTGTTLLFGTDAHQPENLATRNTALNILRGAGLTEESAEDVLETGARKVLERVDGR